MAFKLVVVVRAELRRIYTCVGDATCRTAQAMLHASWASCRITRTGVDAPLRNDSIQYESIHSNRLYLLYRPYA